MAAQWSYNTQAPQSTGTGFNQYSPQYGQQAAQNYGQQQPQQYGHQHFQPPPQAQIHQHAQHYSQQATQHQLPQQVAQQQYPQQTSQQYPQQASQQQYFSQQPYASRQQYSPPQQYSQQQQFDPQQQYPAQQQYPNQTQYPSQQAGQYPNQYPPATSAAFAGQPQVETPHRGCYNCGAPDHWAQACPESIRDNPAGAYNRPPPFKRQKPNPPVVTKYPVPPHVQQQHGPSPQMNSAPYAQQTFPQYQGPQGPHGPPTPQSGQSPHQQWPQQPYQQQYQQAYPQQQQYSQPYQPAGYHYQSQPYMPNAPPTPSTPYETHQSNQSSPQAAHHNVASYFANGHHQQSVRPQPQQTSSASPISAMTSKIAHQQRSINAGGTASTRQSSRNSSVSMRSISVTPTPKSVEITVEEDDDELRQLDVPDIPVFKHGTFPNLVDRPLPANFIVADALEPFDPPPAENDGHCHSKYTVIDKLSTFTSSIKETKHWEDMKHDPIFRLYPNPSKLIPLERILARYQTPHERGTSEPAELEDGEWTRNTMTQTPIEGEDLMDRLENTLGTRPSVAESAHPHGKAPWEQKPRDDALSTRKPDRVVDVVNAMQAPGGQYHWKRKTIRPVPPPPMREESPVPSPEHTPPMRTRTPSMYELNEMHQQEQGVKLESNDDKGSAPHATTTNGHDDTKPHCAYDSSDPFEPPRGPAHVRKPESYDGAADGTSFAGSPNGQVNGKSKCGVNGSMSNGRSYSDEQSASPSRRRSDAAKGRKREPELSDEDNTPKRRQVDDTKCKLKKRQTKVAAAY
ncbi:MAG: hypothetical protein Q9186_005414, partial [Xanthomendoza sp. 1 TL-2023]